MDKPTAKEFARFLDKVQITNSCWLWIASLSNGYGRSGFRGKAMGAHRLFYELFVGPIEMGKYILHRKECGNRSCVNPHHLYMGTQKDNMRDMRLWGKPNMHGLGKTRVAKSSAITAGKRIIQLRLDLDISQGQLAIALDVHRYSIIIWENNRNLPKRSNLQKLAEYFGVSVKFLLAQG